MRGAQSTLFRCLTLCIQPRQRHVAPRLVHVADDTLASTLFDEPHAFPDEDCCAEVVVFGYSAAYRVVIEPGGLGGLGVGRAGGCLRVALAQVDLVQVAAAVVQVVEGAFCGLAVQHWQHGLRAVAQWVVAVAQGVALAGLCVGGGLRNEVAHLVICKSSGVQGLEVELRLAGGANLFAPHLQFGGREQLVYGVVAVVVVVGGGALFQQAACGVADEVGAQGLACTRRVLPIVLRCVAPACYLGGLAWGFTAGCTVGWGEQLVTQPRVVDNDHGQAHGIVFNLHPGAAHTAFFDDAVGRVVLEIEAFAVFIDELLQTIKRYYSPRDLLGMRGFSLPRNSATAIKLQQTSQNYRDFLF